MTDKERIANLLTALETALDLLDYATAYSINAIENATIRETWAELLEYAKFEREKESEGE